MSDAAMSNLKAMASLTLLMSSGDLEPAKCPGVPQQTRLAPGNPFENQVRGKDLVIAGAKCLDEIIPRVGTVVRLYSVFKFLFKLLK